MDIQIQCSIWTEIYPAQSDSSTTHAQDIPHQPVSHHKDNTTDTP